MAEELSVDETNVLRAKLGLPPLRIVLVEQKPSKQEEPANEEAADVEEEEEEDDELVQKDLADSVQEGTLLVLDDVDVLAGSKVNKQRAGLVLPGTFSKKKDKDGNELDEDNSAKSQQKGKKRVFLSAFARSGAKDEVKEELEEAPKLVGARLFVSDLESDPLGDAQDNIKKKKKASSKDKTQEPVKIVRRQLNHNVISNVSLGADESDAENSFRPKVYGKMQEIDEDDDARELEESLRKARSVGRLNKTITSAVTQSSSSNINLALQDGDIFTPSSEFTNISISGDRASGDRKNEVADLSDNNDKMDIVEAAVKKEKDAQGLLVASKTVKTTTAPPETKPKFNRRSLASTLFAVRESGDISSKTDEVIVGRAKDVRPAADINKPGDVVILEYRDDHGRKMTTKERYRQLQYEMRGEGPGAKKRQKRELQLQREQAAKSDNSAASSGAKVLIDRVKKDHVVLPKM